MSEQSGGPREPKKVRSIYFLPNLITVAGMFAGFYAIIAGLQDRFEDAVIAIFVSLIFDGLDGRVARWTNSQSDLGAQLDSLADMVSFGVAPAILAYSWSLSIFAKPGWLVSFIYMVCTALRLARFNSNDQSDEKRYFCGLNTPSSAALVATTIWIFLVNDISGLAMAIPMSMLMLLLSFLKVSSIRYRSFKDFDLHSAVSLKFILVAIMMLVLVVLNPPQMLFIIVLAYVASGPLSTLWCLIQQKWRKRSE